MAIIALHLEFGFGPDRVARFDKKVLEVWNEYADIADADSKSDKEMTETHEKIDRVLRDACGKNFIPWEERYK